MSSKTIRLILMLMLMTIGALFVTQGYWFKKAFDLRESQFDDKLNIALRNVADHLLKLNDDSSSRIPPITKISSNEFYVETNSRFSLAALDSAIRNEFLYRQIDVDFDYIVLKAQSDEVLLGNTVLNLLNTSNGVFSDTSNVACKERADAGENLDFKVRIIGKTTYLAHSMGIWMYSSMTLLGILAVFIFIIISILREKKLSRLKKDFVDNMTHELKTPIANISVASDALRNRSIHMDEHKLKKYADIIYKENTRLHKLVDNVLQISSMEKSGESLYFEEIDLHKIIKDVSLSFEPVIQQRNGNLTSMLKAVRFKLQADRIHLSNVIYNLIENAIKYSDDRPEITVTTANKKGGIHLEICDQGIGINKENQHRIFEKFFRAETGNVHNTKGYGLGLSYVKLIVEKHKGLITFKSTEHVGSNFNIFLPL